MARRQSGSTDPWAADNAAAPVSVAARGARWARDHRRVAGDSVRYVSTRLGASLLVWLLIGIALALPGGLYLVETNLAQMTDTWEGRPGVSVYFQVGAEPKLTEALRDQLAKDPLVARVTLVSASDALEEFQTVSGVSDALAHLERNPLPASLKIVLRDDADAAELDRLATRLKAAAGVDEVSIEKTWLERLRAMTQILTRLGWVLAGMFGLGAVLVTATSVRLAIESRLEELKVMKLVGASDTYIRRPFLYFGLFYGLGGGLAAAMLISAVLRVVEAPLSTLLGSYGENVQLTGLNVAFFGGLLAIGGLLGVCGALLAARQRLANLQVA